MEAERLVPRILIVFISGWNIFRVKLFNGSGINERKMAKSFNFHNNFFSPLSHRNLFIFWLCQRFGSCAKVMRKKKKKKKTLFTLHTKHNKKSILNKHLICASQCNNNEKNGDGLKTGLHYFFHSFYFDHFCTKTR